MVKSAAAFAGDPSFPSGFRRQIPIARRPSARQRRRSLPVRARDMRRLFQHRQKCRRTIVSVLLILLGLYFGAVLLWAGAHLYRVLRVLRAQ